MSGCCPKPKTVTEYYPQYVKPKKVAKAYDDPLSMKQWLKGTNMGNPANVKITMDNMYYLIYQLQQRDSVIQNYDSQAE